MLACGYISQEVLERARESHSNVVGGPESGHENEIDLKPEFKLLG